MQHRKHWFGVQAPLALAGLCLALAPAALAKPGDKVTLCHVPPGDPASAHELVVAPSAAQAHLKNHPGDALGPCAQPPECTSNAQCEDNNPCTTNTCTPAGTCDYTQPVVCDDGNPCTGDFCSVELGGCASSPEPAGSGVCDDGNACTGPDACDGAGLCAGAAVPGCCNTAADCGDADLCTTDVCLNHACANPAVICPTAPACEVSVCNATTGNCDTTPLTCVPDGNICTADTCDPATGGCTYPPVETAPEPGVELTCNDGLDNDCDGSTDAADSDCVVTCPCTDNPAAYPRWAAYLTGQEPGLACARDGQVCESVNLPPEACTPPQGDVTAVVTSEATLMASSLGIPLAGLPPFCDAAQGGLIYLTPAQGAVCKAQLDAVLAASGLVCEAGGGPEE